MKSRDRKPTVRGVFATATEELDAGVRGCFSGARPASRRLPPIQGAALSVRARPGARGGPKYCFSLEPNERNFLSLMPCQAGVERKELPIPRHPSHQVAFNGRFDWGAFWPRQIRGRLFGPGPKDLSFIWEAEHLHTHTSLLSRLEKISIVVYRSIYLNVEICRGCSIYTVSLMTFLKKINRYVSN
jgi:hypothetical protein